MFPRVSKTPEIVEEIDTPTTVRELLSSHMPREV
jgi:hypothetical protein